MDKCDKRDTILCVLAGVAIVGLVIGGVMITA